MAKRFRTIEEAHSFTKAYQDKHGLFREPLIHNSARTRKEMNNDKKYLSVDLP